MLENKKSFEPVTLPNLPIIVREVTGKKCIVKLVSVQNEKDIPVPTDFGSYVAYIFPGITHLPSPA